MSSKKVPYNLAKTVDRVFGEGFSAVLSFHIKRLGGDELRGIEDLWRYPLRVYDALSKIYPSGRDGADMLLRTFILAITNRDEDVTSMVESLVACLRRRDEVMALKVLKAISRRIKR